MQYIVSFFTIESFGRKQLIMSLTYPPDGQATPREARIRSFSFDSKLPSFIEDSDLLHGQKGNLISAISGAAQDLGKVHEAGLVELSDDLLKRLGFYRSSRMAQSPQSIH